MLKRGDLKERKPEVSLTQTGLPPLSLPQYTVKTIMIVTIIVCTTMPEVGGQHTKETWAKASWVSDAVHSMATD